MGTISGHFSFWEFEATSHEDLRTDNIIRTYEVRDNIVELTEEILEPLREAWGSAITISSGYRCQLLNERVGGSPTSSHLKGLAADLVPNNGRKDEFFSFAAKWLKASGRKFDQCIIEKDKKGNRWLHIGLRSLSGQQRGMIFRLTKTT